VVLHCLQGSNKGLMNPDIANTLIPFHLNIIQHPTVFCQTR
jgi:hypothetical protein